MNASPGPSARGAARAAVALVCTVAVVVAGVTWAGPEGGRPSAAPVRPWPVPDRGGPYGHTHPRPEPHGEAGSRGTVRLAFAGDVHFQVQLAALLGHPAGALGPIARSLRAADLTMVNLESAIAVGGAPDPKELEVPDDRYWFRTSPKALAVLAAAGIDVATVANNHGADYGPAGLAETLRARRHSPVAVVGVGRNRRDAFTPYRTTIRGTDIAVLAADSSPRESMRSTWAAGATTPGIAAAHSSRPPALLRAVRAAARTADVVVVYLHWGTELRSCPDPLQVALSHSLARAGADVVLGSHAHVLLGAGWLGDTYVDYGLGNFLWYHDHEPETGVLDLTIRDGKVVGDSWEPARIQPDGRPVPVPVGDRGPETRSWRGLRACTGLSAHGSVADRSEDRRHAVVRPAYSWSVRTIGPEAARRLRSSHHAGCPVPLADLRRLRMTYVGFDGRSHTGELVVHETYVRDVAAAFHRLYDAGWAIRRMRPVEEYGGDDDASMAADNTSGFNCRRVAGTRSWSAHAFGAAIDLNPVENPDLTRAAVAPPAGRRFVTVDRTSGAPQRRGVVTADGVVVRAFAAIGWEWGGTWSHRDYQHFVAAGWQAGSA